MKRTLRALLPSVAIVGLSMWASPAFANQTGDAQIDASVQNLTPAAVSDHWDLDDLTEDEFEALLVNAQVTATTKNRLSDEWVPVGAKITYGSSRALAQGEKFECEWAYLTDDYSAAPVFTGRDCATPLTVSAKDAGRYYYVYGLYSIGDDITGIVVTDEAPRVAIEDTATPVLASKPSFAVGVPATVNVKVARKTATQNYQYEEWETHVSDTTNLDFGGRGVTAPSIGNARVVVTPTLDWCSAYSKIEATVYSSTYAPVQSKLSLPDVITGCPTQRLTTRSEIRAGGDFVVVNALGETAQMPVGINIAQTGTWFVDGKPVANLYDSEGRVDSLHVNIQMSNKLVMLKQTFRVRGFAPFEFQSNTVRLEKKPVPYTAVIRMSGLIRVGEKALAPTYKVDVPGATISYKWEIDGKAVTGETGSSLKMLEKYMYKPLKISATIKAPNYLTVVDITESSQIDPGRIKIDLKDGVRGHVRVGSTLSVEHWEITPGKARVKYDWYADGKRISTTSVPKVKLTNDHLGKKITLRVRATVKNLTYKSVNKKYYFGKVGKAVPTVKASLSSKSIKRSKSVNLKVKVVSPGTTKPVGTVKVTVGKKTFKATVKASHKGKVTIKLKGLAVGKNQAVKVKFTPSSKSTGKFSKSSKTTTVAKITVKK